MERFLLIFLVFCFFSKAFGQSNHQDSLLHLLAKQNDKEAIGTAIKLGNELLMIAPEDAIKYASIALQKAVNAGFRASEAESRNLLANAYFQRSQAGDNKEAFKLYTQNVELFKNAKNLTKEEELEKARSLSGLANIYYQWGEYKESALFNINSLKTREKLKDEFGIARCFNTSGVIYDALGEYKKAIVEYTKALNIYEKLKKKKEVAGVLDNLASSLKLQIENSQEENPDYSQIIDYYNRSLKISEEINDAQGISRTLNNLGILAQNQQDFAKAKKFYEKSIEVALRSQEKQGLASTYNNLARLYQEQELLEEALELYNKALEIAGETESKYELYVTLRERSKVFALKGLFADAYSDLQASNALKVQLDEAENLRTINSLVGRYEIEKFQKENEKLKYEATIQSQNNKIFWGFASFFMMIIIITALFFYRQNQIREKHNHKLNTINIELGHKNKEILAQKNALAEKNTVLNDSINYAQSIQQTILPTEETLKGIFKDLFVFYKPKSTLSGDFYWVASNEEYNLLICGDCTGHGVSGAMMTMMATALLNEIVLAHQIWQPAKILNMMNERIRKYKSDRYGADSVDLGVLLLSANFRDKAIFAGAKMDLWVYQNELYSIKANRCAIGELDATKQEFEQSVVATEMPTTFYMLSDGITDQFGGTKQKKFSTHRLEQLLLSIAHQPLEEQKKQIETSLLTWQGTTEQTDDMVMIALHL